MYTHIFVLPNAKLGLDSLLQRFESPLALLLLQRWHTQELCDCLLRIVCLELLRVIVLVLDVDGLIIIVIVILVLKVIPMWC